jgi:hypothetical protein
MTDHRNRYPGAQPFSDDDFSRKVFFGRDGAARILANKILANRVVTVYARSGLGKTSLLKAGVAPLLREDGYLPLFVRVNDLRAGPFRGLLETVPGEAARQQIEYVPGRSESLWSFFKTAEFWRDDLLLTPVLILDQFEELFTLQSEEARAHFLSELSYLIRGVRPPPDEETPPGETLSEHPPALRIVLSLREDCLGLLEDAAEHIPQILDARFRLAPLDLPAAKEAIVGPAAVTDPGLETRPFELDSAALDAILDHLSQARTRTVSETRRHVEPFQLQLICRRMEQFADARLKESHADVTIVMADLGGEAGLNRTLRDFYDDEAIESLPDRRSRRASRRLCEEYLISPEGRRLSLEENELYRQLGLSREILGGLVASRLLRSETRSESTYYELSHDSLVEPILESRSAKAQIMGMLGIGWGALAFLFALLILVLSPAMMISLAHDSNGSVVGAVIAGGITVLVALVIVVSSAFLLRGSARSMLRYRLARDPTMAGPEMHLQRGFIVGLPALGFGVIIALLGLWIVSATTVIVFGPAVEWGRRVAREISSVGYFDHRVEYGLGLDTLVYLASGVAVLTVGARLCRRGVYRLAGMRRRPTLTLPRKRGRSALLYPAASMLLGAILMLSVVVLVSFDVEKMRCDGFAAGSMPRWLNDWSNTPAVDCMDGAVGVELVRDFSLLTALLIVAVPILRRGIAAIRQVLAGRSLKSPIAHADTAEQVREVNVVLTRPAPAEPSALDHRTQAPAEPGTV